MKPRKKLRATATRRRLGVPDAMDFEEMSEPNMKLSRALLIVLLLHVVAVAGIIAFNAMKSRQGNLPASVATSLAARPVPSATPLEQKDAMKLKTVTRPTTTKEDHKTAADAPKYYVVAKGDNPLTISKKFKVPFDDLLAANHIDDPHKLQIGQKLIIPQKAKPKKNDG